MSLAADPPACAVAAAGGVSVHALNNSGTDKIAYKVKSSNNNEYRIEPVFGFVDAGGKAELKITRTAGAPKEDKLVVHFAVAPADAADAKAAFEGAPPPPSVLSRFCPRNRVKKRARPNFQCRRGKWNFIFQTVLMIRY